jgi:hypothetical protein
MSDERHDIQDSAGLFATATASENQVRSTLLYIVLSMSLGFQGWWLVSRLLIETSAYLRQTDHSENADFISLLVPGFSLACVRRLVAEVADRTSYSPRDRREQRDYKENLTGSRLAAQHSIHHTGLETKR